MTSSAVQHYPSVLVLLQTIRLYCVVARARTYNELLARFRPCISGLLTGAQNSSVMRPWTALLVLWLEIIVYKVGAEA